MKFSTGLVVATLAASGLAQPARRDRHARFHESKRVEAGKLEEEKRAVVTPAPSLAARNCGDLITATHEGQTFTFTQDFLCGNTAPTPAPAAPVGNPAPAAGNPPPVEIKQVEPPKQAEPPKQQYTPQPDAPKQSAPVPAQQSSTPPSYGSGSGSSSSSSSASGGGFVGLAYNDVSFITDQWLGGSAKWAYNWGYEAGALSSKLQYVPMCHGKEDVDGFKSAGFASGTPLLSLNEPDKEVGEGGVNMSPQDACDSHKRAFAGYGANYVSSPAVSSDGRSGKGLDWLSSFQNVCHDAKVDFVTLHWYGLDGQSAEQQASDFKQYVKTAADKVGQLYPGKKIWFTEFAAAPITDCDLNQKFLSSVLPDLKSNPMVERAAPFMVGAKGALGTSTPSVAGKALIAA